MRNTNELNGKNGKNQKTRNERKKKTSRVEQFAVVMSTNLTSPQLPSCLPLSMAMVIHLCDASIFHLQFVFPNPLSIKNPLRARGLFRAGECCEARPLSVGSELPKED